jgi:D-ribose pyranase
MKKSGILHGEISKLIAEAGHGETIVISDYGLPVPDGVKWIDLAVSKGVPSFIDVLNAVVSELTVESITLTTELKENNPSLFAEIQKLVNKPAEIIPHEDFKAACATAKVILRTGEWTPFANVALRAGVVF